MSSSLGSVFFSAFVLFLLFLLLLPLLLFFSFVSVLFLIYDGRSRSGSIRSDQFAVENERRLI